MSDHTLSYYKTGTVLTFNSRQYRDQAVQTEKTMVIYFSDKPICALSPRNGAFTNSDATLRSFSSVYQLFVFIKEYSLNHIIGLNAIYSPFYCIVNHSSLIKH